MADMDPEAVKKLKAENRKYRLQLERSYIFLQDAKSVDWQKIDNSLWHNWELLVSELEAMVGKIPVPEVNGGIAGSDE